MITMDLIAIGLLHESILSKMIADTYQSHTNVINEHINTLSLFFFEKKKGKYEE